MNKAILIQNCHGFPTIEPKFSSFISSRVAAAKRPTTAGLSPLKIFCTGSVFIYFINILLMSIMRTREGSTKAVVATTEPKTDIHMPYPAL